MTPRPRPIRIIADTLAPILATCLTTQPLSPQQTFSVTDSAGIRIVESTSPAWSPGTGWRLGTEPVLTIGDVSGDLDYMFQGVSQAFRMDDGTIVVVDRLASQVSLFDPAGVFIADMGGRGEGPGEFQFLQYAWASGDTIRVSDSMLSRISVFDRAGRVLETIPVEVAPGTGIPTAETHFADGTILVSNAPSGGVRLGTGDVIEGGVWTLSRRVSAVFRGHPRPRGRRRPCLRRKGRRAEHRTMDPRRHAVAPDPLGDSGAPGFRGGQEAVS